MIDKEALLKSLDGIEKLARGSILKRFLINPIKYFSAIGYWRFVYPIKKKGKFAVAKTFFGREMHVVLPSATEIFLFGAKTHDSEIRLARFLIKQLEDGDTFCDVGAHFGFFTLLGSHLVGQKGNVHAFEASKSTFSIFKKNTQGIKSIIANNKAAADTNSTFVFYEHSALFSEYNSLSNPFFHKNEKPKEIKIEGIRLGDYFSENKIEPKIIKIDVEGAELLVLKGFQDYLKNEKPIIIMEYLTEKNQNGIHEEAILFLKELGFSTYIIDGKGEVIFSDSILNNMHERGLTSDNILFIKN